MRAGIIAVGGLTIGVGLSLVRSHKRRREAERLMQKMLTPEAKAEWSAYMRRLYEQGVRQRAEGVIE